MNTQPFDAPDLDHLIATLDPERHPLSAVDRATADALLAQLVTEPVPHPKFGTLRWQRAILPIAAAGTGIVGIALAANLGVLPGLDAAAPPSPAPAPSQSLVVLGAAEPATAADAAVARDACVSFVVPVGAKPEMDILLAERRGDAVFVALRQGQGTLDCIANLPPAGSEVTYVRDIGHYPPTTEQARPETIAADDAVPHYTETTHLTENPPFGEEWMIHRGFYGADVTGLTAEFVGQSLPATLLSDGTFVAWGPFDMTHRPPFQDGLWTYRLTLADGGEASVIAPEAAPSPAPQTMPVGTVVAAPEPINDTALVDAAVEACLANTIQIGPRPQLAVVGAVRQGDDLFIPMRGDEFSMDCVAGLTPGTSEIAEAWGSDYGPVATRVKPADASGPQDIVLSGGSTASDWISLRGFHGSDVVGIVGEYGGHSFPAALFSDRSFLIWGPTTINVQKLGPQENDPATWNAARPVWTLHLTFADGRTATLIREA